MPNKTVGTFSDKLQAKVNRLLAKRVPNSLGRVQFSSHLLLAPMSGNAGAPFRLLMEDLGAGGTVTELISCDGINRENPKSTTLLKLDPKEQNVGIQLFGDDPYCMAIAAKIAEQNRPKFIDLNLGCPARKVIKRGAGAALLSDHRKLAHFFKSIKENITLPLTIKIRTGQTLASRNADQIVKIAEDEGIEFVAIHGRTLAQQYKGEADWQYIEELAHHSSIPIIGNGDLNNGEKIKERWKKTKCSALMIGRGALKNPFIFLEGLDSDEQDQIFLPTDYLEVIKRLLAYMQERDWPNKYLVTHLKKQIVLWSSGFKKSSKFREQLYKLQELDHLLAATEDFLSKLPTYVGR